MLVPLPVALILCLVGVVVFGVSTTLMAKRVGNAIDPLKIAGLSTTDRNVIDRAILLRTLPDDPIRRELARKRAEFIATTDPTSLRWMLLVYFGFFLSLFGLDLIPAVPVSIAVLAIQGLVLLVCVNSTLTGWRMVRFSKEFIERQ